MRGLYCKTYINKEPLEMIPSYWTLMTNYEDQLKVFPEIHKREQRRMCSLSLSRRDDVERRGLFKRLVRALESVLSLPQLARDAVARLDASTTAFTIESQAPSLQEPFRMV
jgi:hypothetical protein